MLSFDIRIPGSHEIFSNSSVQNHTIDHMLSYTEQIISISNMYGLYNETNFFLQSKWNIQSKKKVKENVLLGASRWNRRQQMWINGDDDDDDQCALQRTV